MKKTLFVAFIVQYVGLVTIVSVGLLSQASIPYFDKIVWLLLAETALLLKPLIKVAGLFEGEVTASPMPAATAGGPSATPMPAATAGEPAEKLPRPPPAPRGRSAPVGLAARTATPEAYFLTRQALVERFSEIATFQCESHGEIVTWRGRVRSADARYGSVSIHLQHGRESFFAKLPMSVKERALALRKDDLIEVHGLLTTENMPDAPGIDAEDFHLIEQAP